MSADWFQQLHRHPDLLPPEQRARTGGNCILPILEEYAGAERLPAAELASRQRMRLRALARHCAAQSQHFAGRLRAAGLTPETLAEPGGLAALPPLTRRALVDAGESLFCVTALPAHGPVATTSTSGSTGEPVTVRRTMLGHQHWLAAGLREHLWHGRRFSGRLATLRANVTAATNRPDWGAPCTLLFRTGPSAVQPPTRPISDVVRWLVEFSPQHLLVLPSSLAEIMWELGRPGPRSP